MFTGRIKYFNGSQDRQISGSIWTTINNVTGPALSPNDYADIAFLQAYNSTKWSHDDAAAQHFFQIGAGMFNGTGFVDRPFRVDTRHQFQTYKLALYLYLATVLNDTIPLNVLITLGRMQSSTGGFYTGYVSDYSTNGTTTNTETTSLAILALDRSSRTANYNRTISTVQVSLLTVPLLYLGIGAGIAAIILAVIVVLLRRGKEEKASRSETSKNKREERTHTIVLREQLLEIWPSPRAEIFRSVRNPLRH
ncbi:MAG TPA: hypothetical protein VFE98_05490 [Candidatus Bathyarchaeia archaeon]|nr:hypothetical protein [Candidatus Bathyarchaeia archaeon]